MLPHNQASSYNVSRSTSLVELRISCSSLTKEDFLSKSDPFAILYSLPVDGVKWQEVGRTETIYDTQDPVFTTPFVLEYNFSTLQQLKIEIYDRDSPSEQLNKHDFQGEVEFSLGRVIGAPGQLMTIALRNSRTSRISQNFGKITINAEEVSTCNDVVQIQFHGRKLDKKNGLFGKSDPFLYISRCREDGTWVRVWSSEIIRSDLNPRWRTVQISLQTVCNGDLFRPIRIECFDWEKNGSHQLIGYFQTTMQEISQGLEKPWPLIHPDIQKKKKHKYTHSGEILISRFQIIKRHSMLEYIMGGCEINLIVAIDYTASNGAASTPQSLHFQNPHVYNQYQQSILATGEILQEFDSDHLFPVYGFGGQVNGVVNHCFPLTWDDSHPEVHGVDGILRAYSESFNFVSLSGPTLFAPVINRAIGMASQYSSQEHQKYFVLLILTDGVIMDMQQTIDALVYASRLPLSVVIVGVGNADFSAMEILDGDEKVLRSSNGELASRDIVQFVPFLKFRDNVVLLRDATLKEIPSQFTGYMALRNYKPNPPVVPSGSFQNLSQASTSSIRMTDIRQSSQYPSGQHRHSQTQPPPSSLHQMSSSLRTTDGLHAASNSISQQYPNSIQPNQPPFRNTNVLQHQPSYSASNFPQRQTTYPANNIPQPQPSYSANNVQQNQPPYSANNVQQNQPPYSANNVLQNQPPYSANNVQQHPPSTHGASSAPPPPPCNSFDIVYCIHHSF